MSIKTLFKTSLLSVGALHCINKIIDSNTSADNSTRTSGKFYHWKHGNIFYRVNGQGKPVLLIHDLTVFSSSYEWSKMIGYLAEKHTVYTIDLIGCGRSDKPPIIYTNYYYTQLIRDFVNEIIKEKTDVAASGLSASFVMMANMVDEDLFDNIVLLNPSDIRALKKTPDRNSKAVIKLFRLPVIGKTLYYMAVNKDNTEYLLTEKLFYCPFKLNPSMIKSFYAAAHTDHGNGKMLFASLKGYYLNMDISKAVANAKNRIILICGSKIENREEIEASYLRLNKNIISFSVPKAKYLPHLEVPEQMRELLRVLS